VSTSKTIASKKIAELSSRLLGASPYDTPSMYHLMTHVDMNQGVFYPQGGLHSVIEAIARLAQQYGVEIHTSSPVTKILTDGNKAVGLQVGSSEYLADVVVASADLHHVETKIA